MSRGGGVDLSKQVREVGVTPLSTGRLAKTGPQELGCGAREEDVVSILHYATQGADPVSWSIAPEDLYPRAKASPDPLPQEDADL